MRAGLLATVIVVALLPLGSASEPTWGDPAVARLRPGGSLGGYCTLNFVFTDAAGNAYIGTAAHCTDDSGDRVSTSGVGEWGTVVYDSDTAPGAARTVDFSLIRIDPEDVPNTHPSVLGVGGPTGIAARSELTTGERLDFHGYGLVFGSAPATRERFGVLVQTTPTLYRADMPAVNGDSGAPIVSADDGKAMGIVSHYGLPYSTDEGPLMTFVMAELQKANLGVSLVPG